MSIASDLEPHTVLTLGARGKLGGARFALVGRTAVKSEGGGSWNEWTLRFDDGREAFLAEAMGGFTLYWPKTIAPDFDALDIGEPLDTTYVVSERGRAKRVASWGDVADAPKTYRYADLSSRTGGSATIDYGAASGSNAPDVFVGRRTSLADLGLAPRKEPRRFLPAPGGTPPRDLELFLSVGDEGTFEGTTFRIIGIVQRSLRVDGVKYTWEEHVLFDAEAGLRWLVVANGHWNLATPIDVGVVDEAPEDRAFYRGEAHRFVSGGKARVEWATGELPFTIAAGDTTNVRDYARAPQMLSREATDDEVTWSLAIYTPPDVIARAFGKRVLPKPEGRAPNQPSSRTPSKSSRSS